MQRDGKYLGALAIVIGVALMARHVSIVQRMKRHASVCSIFVIRLIVAAMTGATALFARVDSVPLALLPYRMRLAWHAQHDGFGSSHCATAACGANNTTNPIASALKDPTNKVRETLCADMSASL
jgi:hypothetical protein